LFSIPNIHPSILKVVLEGLTLGIFGNNLKEQLREAQLLLLEQFSYAEELREDIAELEQMNWSEKNLAMEDLDIDELIGHMNERLAMVAMNGVPISEEAEDDLIMIYHHINIYKFSTTELPIQSLVLIPDELKRLNQVEALMNLYTEKMSRVRNDMSLREEDRDTKIANWERLMERDIKKIENE